MKAPSFAMSSAMTLLLFSYSLGLYAQTPDAAKLGPATTVVNDPTADPNRGEGAGRRAQAQALFGDGTIPTLAHRDRVMTSRPRGQCKTLWSRLRARPVSPRRLGLSSEELVRRGREAGISPDQLRKTLAVYLANQEDIPNQRFISLIDYSRRADRKRLFLIDTQTGRIRSYFTAHGRGSDPNQTGFARQFSNRPGSRMSSVGCFLAAGEYRGTGGRRSLMLHGFESSNDRSCERAIVMHGAGYTGTFGRSWGCPTLRWRDVNEVFGAIGGGGLICAHR
jgi:L,D-transpeptidase catalytic domain